MNILGIHGEVTAYQHDSSAALVVDGALVCFVSEERLNRIKYSFATLPIRSIQACLNEMNFTIKDIDCIITSGETYKDIIPRTKEWVTHHFGSSPKVEILHHQTAHIASSFFQSGFDDAMCLSYDGVGDRASGAIAKASKDKGIEIIEMFPKSRSLGNFYSTMTNFLGFKSNEDEYKVMGLAPYGNANIDLSFFCQATEEGNTNDPSYWNPRTDPNPSVYEPLYSRKLVGKLGEPRMLNAELTDHYKNIAASTQYTLEKCAISNIKRLHKITRKQNLCLAGGVALNCSANGVISKLPFVKKLFVQPASSDDGLALGCALYGAFKANEKIQPIEHVFYGPKIGNEEIEKSINLTGFKSRSVDNPAKEAAILISQKKILAWYQGRMALGPRALGHRSILADPQYSDMKDIVNKKIKFREEFRPFAPSVLEEKANTIFDLDDVSPFMTVACKVKDDWPRRIPSTVHINNTSRVQTVNKKTDPLFHSLIKTLGEMNGNPVVLNTSFNIRGQPIVQTPLEAISTFAGSGIDYLMIGNYLLEKISK